MILRQSRLLVADNSGARIAMCIGIPGRPPTHASVGRLIKVAIKEIKPGVTLKVRPGEVHNALIIRCRQMLQRNDGRTIKFDENACVLLGADLKPIGTRVSGPIPMELKKGNWLKILSLSSRVI